MNYDPNLTTSGRMAKQTVRLTFGLWDYRKAIEIVVGGNCTGLSVIETAIENVYNHLPERFGTVFIVLERGEDTLEVEDEDDMHSDWLRDMLVAAEIVAIEADEEATQRWRAA